MFGASVCIYELVTNSVAYGEQLFLVHVCDFLILSLYVVSHLSLYILAAF